MTLARKVQPSQRCTLESWWACEPQCAVRQSSRQRPRDSCMRRNAGSSGFKKMGFSNSTHPSFRRTLVSRSRLRAALFRWSTTDEPQVEGHRPPSATSFSFSIHPIHHQASLRSPRHLDNHHLILCNRVPAAKGARLPAHTTLHRLLLDFITAAHNPSSRRGTRHTPAFPLF